MSSLTATDSTRTGGKAVLVLEDGTVGGLVFAESRTDAGVGYALTPGEVADRVAPAVGSQGSVDLGPCIR